ncbi:hypothetical protein COV16_03795 [Candidatus Woesearchaeota archaeon CG10_big_fil_rev_8_21_14_0_10_34_8]|nr:MAG: hypothetical protein COV16_03795 [Candidatus Woesearchaeota archaeon CG10_big_fil_rev_8_21_14_0_10_34_8]
MTQNFRQLYALGLVGLIACKSGYVDVINEFISSVDGAESQEQAYYFPDFNFHDVNPKSDSYSSSVSLNDLLIGAYNRDDETNIIVNFWIYGCAPCMQEMPFLQNLHENSSAEVVSISATSYMVFDPKIEKDNYGYDLRPTKEVMAEVSFPVLGGKDEEEITRFFYESMPFFSTIEINGQEYPRYYFPLTVIIDASGDVIKHIQGYDPAEYNDLLYN